MTKEKRASIVRRILNKLFPNPPIPLKHKDHYTLLIAVLLSAQCTDKKVNEITPKLFAKASDPYEMVELTVKQIESIIRPCGLAPTKAKAIHRLSEILIDDYQGKIPRTLEELEALPGVGHKTASVVTIQALKKPAFPVDTHIHRCAKRWGLSCGKSVKQTEKDLKAIFPKTTWKKLHLQIIYYARQYCPAKKHSIDECPICNAISKYN
ncbi:endonuclease III domain-containing protein [Candidatus Neptunichlamydia sp. REUL1]|uniref:endonuclease III domain-containing protein n=1 Tax=Candidatus Neptunichlamydia sp. REUL1 TaxID=3064277 RepID=UPI00292EF3AF|nr:endonuclease III [Candidatus Neptunochlamydia sp. REUL1]